MGIVCFQNHHTLWGKLLDSCIDHYSVVGWTMVLLFQFLPNVHSIGWNLNRQNLKKCLTYVLDLYFIFPTLYLIYSFGITDFLSRWSHNHSMFWPSTFISYILHCLPLDSHLILLFLSHLACPSLHSCSSPPSFQPSSRAFLVSVVSQWSRGPQFFSRA